MALGNIVLVDHGQTVRDEPLGTVPESRLRRVAVPPARSRANATEGEPIPPRFRPALRTRR